MQNVIYALIHCHFFTSTKYRNVKYFFYLAGNDIALIRLPRAVNTVIEDSKGSNILPVCLGWKSDIDMPNPQFRLSLILGWGKENNERFDKGDLSYCGAYSCGLKKAYVPITPLAECKQQHKFAFQIFSSMHICAGAEGIVLFVKCYSIRLLNFK